MDMKEVGERVHDTSTGIYYGYTMLKGTVYPAVVSVGWNPYFDNKEKTVVSASCPLTTAAILLQKYTKVKHSRAMV